MQQEGMVLSIFHTPGKVNKGEWQKLELLMQQFQDVFNEQVQPPRSSKISRSPDFLQTLRPYRHNSLQNDGERDVEIRSH